jgi:hypothetical protein
LEDKIEVEGRREEVVREGSKTFLSKFRAFSHKVSPPANCNNEKNINTTLCSHLAKESKDLGLSKTISKQAKPTTTAKCKFFLSELWNIALKFFNLAEPFIIVFACSEREVARIKKIKSGSKLLLPSDEREKEAQRQDDEEEEEEVENCNCWGLDLLD